MTSADIVRELHVMRPAAPDALRERIRLVASTGHERAPGSPRRPWRALLVALPAAVALAAAAAGTIGLVDPGGERDATRTAVEQTAQADAARSQPAGKAGSESAVTSPPAATSPGGVPAPTVGRAQRVSASLTIRVTDNEALSRATQRALETTRTLGGFVVSVSYATAEEGQASLTLRVPTTRVQDAITRLSSLGTIVAQQVQIDDLQESIDALDRRVTSLRERIARLTAQLTEPGLDADTRAALEARRSAAQRELAQLRADRAAQAGEARLATIQLTLLTEGSGEAVPVSPSRGDRALDRAGEILAWEATAALYALVLVGPLALFALVAWLARRALRRREEERLLAAR